MRWDKLCWERRTWTWIARYMHRIYILSSGYEETNLLFGCLLILSYRIYVLSTAIATSHVPCRILQDWYLRSVGSHGHGHEGTNLKSNIKSNCIPFSCAISINVESNCVNSSRAIPINDRAESPVSTFLPVCSIPMTDSAYSPLLTSILSACT
jgi:hypothetical protein